MKFEGGMGDNGERKRMELKRWIGRGEEVEIGMRKREIWREKEKRENLSEK